MSAQELLQGVCHSGGCCLLPLALGLLLLQFQHHSVPWTSWKCCCHLQQCRGNKRKYPGFAHFSLPKLFTSQLPTPFIQFITFSSPSSFQFLPQSSNLPASVGFFALRYFLIWMLGHDCPRHNIVAQQFFCCQRIEVFISLN